MEKYKKSFLKKNYKLKKNYFKNIIQTNLILIDFNKKKFIFLKIFFKILFKNLLIIPYK
jgi:hypothetical protein